MVHFASADCAIVHTAGKVVMLHLSNAEGYTVLVLSHADLVRLQDSPLASANGKILLALSPDLAWTSAAFKEADAMGQLDTAKILAILATSIAKTQA